MKKQWAVAVGLLLGCGTYSPPTCRTLCGLQLTGDMPQRQEGYDKEDADWSCGSLQAIEDAVLSSFNRIEDQRFRKTCEIIGGFAVSVLDTEKFEAAKNGGLAIGQTFCGIQQILLSNLPPNRSALPHELAHAVQQCNAM